MNPDRRFPGQAPGYVRQPDDPGVPFDFTPQPPITARIALWSTVIAGVVIGTGVLLYLKL